MSTAASRMSGYVKKLEQQRDELLAQNERLRTILTRVMSCDELIFNSDVVLAVDSELKNDIEDALNETPAQSLEALKNEWQAEAQRTNDVSSGVVK